MQPEASLMLEEGPVLCGGWEQLPWGVADDSCHEVRLKSGQTLQVSLEGLVLTDGYQVWVEWRPQEEAPDAEA